MISSESLGQWSKTIVYGLGFLTFMETFPFPRGFLWLKWGFPVARFDYQMIIGIYQVITFNKLRNGFWSVNFKTSPDPLEILVDLVSFSFSQTMQHNPSIPPRIHYSDYSSVKLRCQALRRKLRLHSSGLDKDPGSVAQTFPDISSVAQPYPPKKVFVRIGKPYVGCFNNPVVSIRILVYGIKCPSFSCL